MSIDLNASHLTNNNHSSNSTSSTNIYSASLSSKSIISWIIEYCLATNKNEVANALQKEFEEITDIDAQSIANYNGTVARYQLTALKHICAEYMNNKGLIAEPLSDLIKVYKDLCSKFKQFSESIISRRAFYALLVESVLQHARKGDVEAMRSELAVQRSHFVYLQQQQQRHSSSANRTIRGASSEAEFDMSPFDIFLKSAKSEKSLNTLFSSFDSLLQWHKTVKLALSELESKYLPKPFLETIEKDVRSGLYFITDHRFMARKFSADELRQASGMSKENFDDIHQLRDVNVRNFLQANNMYQPIATTTTTTTAFTNRQAVPAVANIVDNIADFSPPIPPVVEQQVTQKQSKELEKRRVIVNNNSTAAKKIGRAEVLIQNPPQTTTITVTPSPSPARKRQMGLTKMGQRKRMKWTEEEVDDLKEGLKLFGVGKWKQILNRFDFEGRTAVDLKDKYRNLIKKYTLQELIGEPSCTNADDAINQSSNSNAPPISKLNK